MSRRRNGALGVALLSAVLVAPADAQIQASERGTVSQVVDGTLIKVDYARPQLRGRTGPFGAVVHWEEMWTPGANWATTFEFGNDVQLNGHEVPAGAYSVWIQPRADQWTVHLNQTPRLFHTQMPAVEDQFLSFEVSPLQGEPLEVLTFSFPEVRRNGALLRFQWGPSVLEFDIAVRPAYPIVAVSEAEAAPYVGEYSLTIYEDEGREPAVMDVRVLRAEDGSLRASINDGVFEMLFIPTGQPHTFLPGMLQDGEIANVETSTPAVFEVRDGQARRFALTGEVGEWMVGVRKD